MDYSVNVEIPPSDSRVIRIFGSIGAHGSPPDEPVGTTSLDVTDRVIELIQLGRAPIQVLINSTGGSVWEMLAILDALDMAKQHRCRVLTRCHGQAQSAAADILVVGGDRRTMSPNSFVMVHGSWDKNLWLGDDLDLEAEQKLRAIYNDRLLDLYTTRTARPSSFWREIFRDLRPVYFSPKEALRAGLVDEVC